MYTEPQKKRYKVVYCIIVYTIDISFNSFIPFDISVGVGAFVIGLSQISSFFS